MPQDVAESRAAVEAEEIAQGANGADWFEGFEVPEIGVHGERCAVSAELFADLELPTLVDALDTTYTRGGRAFLTALLRAPVRDVETLRARQASLMSLESKGSTGENEALLATLRDTEKDVAWMARFRDDETLRTLYSLPYFSRWPFRKLNAVPAALTAANLHRVYASPSIGLLAPITYFVVPYLVVRGMGVRMPIKAYLRVMFRSMALPSSLGSGSASWMKLASSAFSLVFYFQSVFTSFEVSATLSKVCGSLTGRAQNVAAFFGAAEALEKRLTDAAIAPWFTLPSGPGGAGVLSRVSGRCGGEGRLFRRGHFGKELHALHTFDHAAATSALRRAYVVDALLSVPRSVEKLGGSWATFLSTKGPKGAEGGPGPVLRLRGMRHPSVAEGVANTWLLGAQTRNGRRNALLTGPNAGGKSTLLKGVLVSALLAQTLTFAPASPEGGNSGCEITPFSYISSHINVPDAQGRESLFEAEMRRAKRNVDALHSLAKGEFALVVMDEIFSSTNPVEGIAGAFAIAKHMAACPGAITIISTHYTYLATLSSTLSPTSFANFKMPVELDESTGAVVAHPYRLRRGVSTQYVALELLRASGFDAAIIADAIAVKKALLAGTPSGTPSGTPALSPAPEPHEAQVPTEGTHAPPTDPGPHEEDEGPGHGLRMLLSRGAADGFHTDPRLDAT